MLSDPSRIGNATQEIFDKQYWLGSGRASPTPAGRGDALFVEHEGRQWVLRHYRRGGWMAKISRDRYVWIGEARTRPYLEWRLLSDLHREGLPVPAPVAARYVRHGLTYSGDLITERIPGARPLSSLLSEGALLSSQQSSQWPSLWHAIGQCIRRFHDAGVYHADLNTHNILINDQGAVFLIDFDRGERRADGQVDGQWKAQNLSRLKRSLHKVTRGLPAERIGEQGWNALIKGYRG